MKPFEMLQKLDIQILTALIAFIGVIIGVIISSATTVLADWIKFNRDEKIYYKRKKEEAYVEIMKFVGSYEMYGEPISSINKELMLNTLALTRLYNSKKVQKCLSEIMNNDSYWNEDRLIAPQEKIAELSKLMREDLRIDNKNNLLNFIKGKIHFNS